MCCHESKHHSCGDQPHHHHDECCCKNGHSDPAFWTRDEKISWLERQRNELQETLTALERRIAALREES